MARLWTTDHYQPVRIFSGHFSDVDVSASTYSVFFLTVLKKHFLLSNGVYIYSVTTNSFSHSHFYSSFALVTMFFVCFLLFFHELTHKHTASFIIHLTLIVLASYLFNIYKYCTMCSQNLCSNPKILCHSKVTVICYSATLSSLS